jgi:membrane protease YdiL (CAAX protease family)
MIFKMNIDEPYQNHSNFNYSHKGYAYKSIIKIIILYLFGGLCLSIIQFTFLKSDSEQIFSIYSQGILQILLLLLPTLFFARRALLPTSVLFRKKTSVNSIQISAGIIGILAFQLFATGYTVLQEKIIPDFLFQYYKEIEETIENMYIKLLGGSGFSDLARALLIGSLIPAISEETLFRGFLQSSLEQDYKPHKAIIITALIFSILHLNPTGLIPLIFIGLFLGFVAWSTNNLILPMIIHFVNNTFAIIIIFSPQLTTIENQISDVSLFTGILLLAFGLIVLLISCFIIFFESKFKKIASI